MIRVLLVEDHAAFRQALAFVMEREADLTVVGQARSMQEAQTMLHGVDVAVVDLNLPDGHGVDLVRAMRDATPDTVVLVLTGSQEPAEHAQALEVGATAVVQKTAGIPEIIAAVRRAR